MRPMNQFDPDRRAVVHDRFHGRSFLWRRRWAKWWRNDAWVSSDGLAYFDGLILDGWEPLK